MKYFYLLIFIVLSSSVVANDQTPLFSIASKIEGGKYQLLLTKQVKSLTKQNLIKLEIPELGIKEYKLIRSYSTEKDQQIWLGKGEKHSSVSLIQSAFGLSGSIRATEGTWLIRLNKDGQSSLEKFDKSQYQQVTDILPIQEKRVKKTTKQNVTSSSYNANYFQHIQTQEPAGFSESNDIRILIYYSDQAILAYPNLEDLIELDFADANQALVNSNIEATYTLAGLIRLADKKGDTNLYDMLERTGNFERMDEMRDKYDADLAHFYGWRLTGESVCGVAFYSVDSTGWVDSRYGVGATAPMCTGTLTFAHEVGHNLGARHDRYVQDGGTDDYAYGYVDLENEFQTIMSFTDKCNENGKYCTEITHYSNPEINYNEQPTGIDKAQVDAADNSQLITHVANVVANYNGVGYPSDFQVSKGTFSNKVTLTWAALAGSDGYEIKRELLNGTCPIFKDVYSTFNETTDTSYTVDEVSSEQYCYWIRAYKDHAYGARNFSAPTPVEIGYSAELAVHISDIIPQNITEQKNSLTISFSTNVSTDVSVAVVDSNAVNWLDLSVESVGDNQYQLILTNNKEISASALLVIKAGGTQEYLPLQFSGYSNQPPTINVVDTVEIEQGGSISIPVTLTDDVDSEALSWGFYSEDANFIDNKDISYSDGELTIALSHELYGSANIVFTAYDGELQTRKTIAVNVKRTIYHAATIPEEVTLYVDAGETLIRLLPGYSIDNDEIFHQLIQSPTNGELAITGDSFTYQANADFIEDSFILQSQLVANGDENIATELHTTVVTLLPLPILQLPYQQQMIEGRELTILLTHRGELWYWGQKVDLVDGFDEFVKILVPTLLNSDNWVDMTYHSGLRTLVTLKADGTLWVFGNLFNFDQNATTSWQPIQVGTDTDWVAINGIAGKRTDGAFLRKRDGSLWALQNIWPVFGIDNYEFLNQARQINGLYNWVDSTGIKEGYQLLNDQGVIWTGGGDRIQTLGRKSTNGLLAPVDIPEPVLNVKGDFWRNYAYTASGIYAWGKNIYLISGNDNNFYIPTLVNEDTWQSQSVGDYSFSGVTLGGELYTASAQYAVFTLGRGEGADPRLAQVGTETNWLTSYSLEESNYALKSDGSLWVTGYSMNGLTLGLEEERDTKIYQFTKLENLPIDILGTEDTDNDGVLNFKDDDDDNDCIMDSLDNNPDVVDENGCLDTDSDGLINVVDRDDDNDGVLDIDDAFPLDANDSVDTDGDGQGNNADTDDDNDGVLDTDDAFPLDANESVDTDGDGQGNNTDTDDDNDGVLDSSDAYPLDASRSIIAVSKVADKSSGGGGSMHVLLLLLLSLSICRKRYRVCKS